MLRHNIAPDEATLAAARARSRQPAMSEECDIVLRPLSHPELNDIHIAESLFAIGRTEEPFASYAPAIVTDLSRRHARIFAESGAVYIADLNSKNGTSVNGVEVRQKTSRLRDGDEICFGRTLCYRVQLDARLQTRGRPSKLISLTLTPEGGDLGVQPIVVTQFPFLISKADATFSRYKEEYPHQVNYLSRRHAHIFLKGGAPFVEDLGSTNGTFVGGKRLDEHAVPLHDGDVVAFGGHHFVYKVSLQKQESEIEPTVTMLSPLKRSVAESAGNADKTTFVAAADSFLDIFCVDQAAQQEDEADSEAAKRAEDAARGADKQRPRSRIAIELSELRAAFFGGEGKTRRVARWWAATLALLISIAALLMYLGSGTERDVKEMLARGENSAAAALADEYVKRDPDNAELKALATEAQLKANVPTWLGLLKAHQFDQAAALLAGMKQSSTGNTDLQLLINELEWMGNLQRLVLERGGIEAPIHIFRHEDRITTLLKQWDDDAKGHQRALGRIASYVPEFRDPYTETLSHLRRLQSDDSVYLAAIDRLKATIDTELNRDRPEALEAALTEYAEKYPRIGGLDSVRRDLRLYSEIDHEARARNLGPLVTLASKAKFSTPPFEAKFRALAASDRMPPADVIRQYQAVSAAWQKGNTGQAFDGLQKMTGGPWGDSAAKELTHKKALADQFAALQKARGGSGYDERLLAFYGALRPDEDVHFVRAIEADIGQIKGKALARARELLNKAQESWSQYRANGAIEGRQRLESTISDRFRTQARLLSQADQSVQEGMRIITQLKADPAQWGKLRDEIGAEAELQRKSLQELRSVLEPGLLKAKLALLGNRSNDERQPPKAVN